jgi:hypothetical protein
MNMDTSPEVEAIQFRFYREAPAWRKLQMVAELNHAAQELAMSGIRQRYPEATPEEHRRYLADLLLGPELAAKVYSPLPLPTIREPDDQS